MIGDTDVTALPTHRIARLGISRTFQNLALFKGMTVLENLMVGALPARQGGPPPRHAAARRA